MSRGIRNARITFLLVMAVMVVAGAVLFVVGLVTGKWQATLSLIPVAVGFVAGIRAYRADPEHFHKRMSGGEIALAVLPVALVLVAFAVAAVIDRVG